MVIQFHKIDFFTRRLIKKIFSVALFSTDNFSVECEVNVSFVKGEKIRELNKLFRGVDKVTDVLSFPLLDIKYPQKLSEFEEEVSPDGVLRLGDIVICKERAKEQARQFGHSLKREIAFLSLHGLLHLLGFDHIEKEDEKVMNEVSEKILASLNIKRGENV